jgi:hypothetical protein
MELIVFTWTQWTGKLMVTIVEGKLGCPAEWEEVSESNRLGPSIPELQGQHLLSVQIQADKELPISGFMGPLDFHVHPMLPMKILSPGESGNQAGDGAGGAWTGGCPGESFSIRRLTRCQSCAQVTFPHPTNFLPLPEGAGFTTT